MSDRMTTSPFFQGFTVPDSRKRRLAIAAGIYLVCTAVYLLLAAHQTLTEHTQYDHYALLADAWLHGRQDLANGPPGYAMGNDFAQFNGKTFITFPPFPALLMLPLVALSRGAENFRDGQFIIEVAGLAPAFLFLVLEKLRRSTARGGEVRSDRSEAFNAGLALLFAFGTVYFFTAEEGTVWYAAHIVCAGVFALYVLFALDAERPLLAGLFLGCVFATRPHMLLAGSLFTLEALRVHLKSGLPTSGTWEARLRAIWDGLDKRAYARDLAIFAIPIALVIGIESWMNHLRFETWNPTVGHEYLTVAWAARMRKWGLFSPHFLAKNLGVALTMLPWLPAPGAPSAAPFQINEHGLAIWFTMPFYLWILWPKRSGFLYVVLAISALLPAFQELLYQNSGWRQFGYRFSNDYAILLFALLAVGNRSAGRLFKTAAAWGIAWNLFGAVTFDRREYERFYFREGTQTVLYQPD
jgi:hypothetical protein